MRLLVLTFLTLSSITINLSAQLDTEKVLKKMEKENRAYNRDYGQRMEAFVIYGRANLEGFEIPVEFSIQMPSKMRMTLTAMGNSYIIASNGFISWEYDPGTGEYSFSDDTKSDKSDPFAWWFLDQNEIEGFELVSASNTMLEGSQEAIELKYVKEQETVIYYLDPESYLVIGSVIGAETSYYFPVKRYKGVPFGSVIKNTGTEDDLDIVIDSISFSQVFDQSIFDVPEGVEVELEEETSKTAAEYLESGDALRGEGKYKEAIKEYNQGLEVDRDAIGLLNSRGLAKLELNEIYSAIGDFQRALELDSVRWPVVHNNLGMAKYYLGDYESAQKDFEKAIELDASTPLYFQNLGQVFIQKEDYEQVVQAYTRAIALDSAIAGIYYYRAVAYAQLDRYEEALTDYNREVALGTESPYLSNMRGVTLYSLDRYEEAKAMFRQAIEQDASDLQYLENLGNAQRELEEYEESIDTYSKIIERDSSYSDSYSNRGQSKFDLGRYKEALLDFDLAIDLSPEGAYYYDQRGFTKEKLSDFAGAVEDFSSSLRLDQDPNIYYHRGLVRIKMDDKTEGCRDLRRALEDEHEKAQEAVDEHCK